MVQDLDAAINLSNQIAPEHLEINVKNDEMLVKMAGIVQKIIASEQKIGSENEFGLSEDERKRLLEEAEEEIKNIQDTNKKENGISS